MGNEEKMSVNQSKRAVADHMLVPGMQIKRAKEGQLKSGDKVVFVECLFMGGSINCMCDPSLLPKVNVGTVGDAVFKMDMKMLDVFDYGRKENKCVFLVERLVDFAPQKL